MARENIEAASIRSRKVELLQRHYASFNTFMQDMMKELGFEPTWMQHDIAAYLQHGPQYLMIQAQRGEAKTTITAMYAVWSLIHDPKHRVLIVSAGGKTANEISTLIQRIILTVDTLACLRPDPNNGDRTSVEAFDVHYSLKGIDKSPSVACIGITGNLPGKRADLLIADDIESPKNSMTAGNREMLHQLSLEFTAICSFGRIVYLGTPQTSESIYNSLPGRGFAMRIWPGRYPNPAQMSGYGQYLAPTLRAHLEADPSLAFGGGVLGDQGKPTDPALFDEETLQKKQLDRGASSFQLNYMLNTKLMDSMRFPLKLENLVVLRGGGGKFPLVITRGFGAAALRDFTSSGYAFKMSAPHEISQEVGELTGIHMRVDPAGGGVNGDETAYAVTGFLNGNVYVLAAGGVPGGYEYETLLKLAEIAEKWGPQSISVEKNMGHGAFTRVWLPILRTKWKGSITDDFVSGQKEVRIIGTLEPIMGRGSLIIMEDVVEQDDLQTEVHASGKRMQYSLFHQLAKLTRTKKSLVHDDRADALEGAVRFWLDQIAVDQKEIVAAQEAEKMKKFMADPLGHNRYTTGVQTGCSLLNKYRR